MRRIDVIGIGIGIFAIGGLLYFFLKIAGTDSLSAGIWSQAVLVGVLIIWLLTYLLRVATKNMTYNQQLKDYEDAFLEKRIQEMTPAEWEKFQAELESEKSAKSES